MPANRAWDWSLQKVREAKLKKDKNQRDNVMDTREEEETKTKRKRSSGERRVNSEQEEKKKSRLREITGACVERRAKDRAKGRVKDRPKGRAQSSTHTRLTSTEALE